MQALLNFLAGLRNAAKDAFKVELSGSNIDRRGLAANKPEANTVDPGTIYWSVDTDPHGDAIEVSDGTDWTVIV